MKDRTEALGTWWSDLSDKQRTELLALNYRDPVPSEYVVGLTHALGVGPMGVKWESEPGYTFLQDDRLTDFLDSKREPE